MKRIIKGSIAVILSLIMTIQMIPLTFAEDSEKSGSSDYVISEEFDETELDYSTENDAETDDDEIPEIVCENVDEREEFTKVFRLSDGSFLSSVYPSQVNFEEDGEMKEIDNSLEKKVSDNEEIYTNKSNPVKVIFPSTYAKKDYITYTCGEYSVMFALKDIKKSEAIVSEPTDNSSEIEELQKRVKGEKLTEGEYKKKYKSSKKSNSSFKLKYSDAVKKLNNYKMTVENVSSSLTYKSIRKNIDLNYNFNGTELKENIIINEYSKQTEKYAFTVVAPGLHARKDENNSVIFMNDKGEEIFEFGSPYMVDSKDEASDKIEVTFEQINEDTYEYILIPDKEWLCDKSRAYPVVIDPPISNSNFNTVKDTTGVFNTSVGNLESNGEPYYLKVGNRYDSTLGTVKEVQSMLYSPIPSSVENSEKTKIIKAELVLCGYRMGISTCPNGIQVNAYAITSDWNTANIMENSVIPLGSNGRADYSNILDYVILNDGDAESYHGQAVIFDITEAAEDWLEGYKPNYGIALRATGLGTAENFARFFDSTNLQSSGACPQFIYQYRSMEGTEDYWSFTGVSAGRGGTASVNNYNGNPVITLPMVSGAGNNMPVSVGINYSYNSRIRYNYDNSLDYDTGFGEWRTNYHMTIEECNLSLGTYECPYCYIDSDGTKHYLKKNVNGSEVTYTDEDGLGLTLKLNVESEYKYQLEAKDKTLYKFDSNGKLKQIKDPKGNYNNISYMSDGAKDHRISTIKEGNVSSEVLGTYTTTFTYGSDYVRIGANGGQSWAIARFPSATNKLLYSIQYEDSTSVSNADNGNVTIGYSVSDGTYFPSTISDGFGHVTTFVHNMTGASHRVASISWGSGTSDLERYTFSYSHNMTEITDIDGQTLTYQFDNQGYTVGVFNKATSCAQSYVFAHHDDNNDGYENKLLQASKVFSYSGNLLAGGSFPSSNYVSDFVVYPTGSGLVKEHLYGFSTSDPWCMKLTKPSDCNKSCTVYQGIHNITPGNYTLSMYVSTYGHELQGAGISALIGVYTNSGYRTDCSSIKLTFTDRDEWVRLQATVTVLQGDTRVHVGILFPANTYGTVYVDDIQFEKNICGGNIDAGDNVSGAGSFNFLSNSDFSSSFDHWGSTGFSVSSYTGSDAPVAVKKVNVASTSGNASELRAIGQMKYVTGVKDDVFVAGVWAKVNSSSLSELTNKVESPNAGLYITFYNGTTRVGQTVHVDCNVNTDKWQYLMVNAVAPGSYDRVQFMFRYHYNTGNAVIACPFLYKESYGQSFTYDSDGNLLSSSDVAKTESTFAYKDNLLSSSVSPTGSNYIYTYNELQNNLLYAYSNSGQKINYSYNASGDATYMNIYPVTFYTSLSSVPANTKVCIINAKSGLALGAYISGTAFLAWSTERSDRVVELKDVSGSVCSILVTTANKILKSSGTDTSFKAEENASGTDTKFKFVANGDGTFRILTGKSGYVKSLSMSDGKFETGIHRLTTLPEYDDTKPENKWYIVSKSGSEKITTSAQFTEDQRFANATVDQSGNKVSYSYDSNTGNLLSESVMKRNSADDEPINTTVYTYDNMDRVTGVSSEGASVGYTYSKDQLSAINVGGNNGFQYSFEYDAFGRKTNVKVGTQSLASYQYTGTKMTSQTYGNGDSIAFTYDSLDRVKTKTYNNSNGSTSAAVYVYDSNGNLYLLFDGCGNKRTINEYDLAGRLVNVNVTSYNGQTPKAQKSVRYNDKKGTVKSVSTAIFDSGALKKALNYSYTYGDVSSGQMPDMLYSMTVDGTTFSNVYDSLGRSLSKSVNTGSVTKTESYTYEQGGANGSTTTLVDTFTDLNGVVHEFEYDESGNITSEKIGDATISYQYDPLNRLVRVDDEVSDYTAVYEYDIRGNILRVYASKNGKTDSDNVSNPELFNVLNYTYGNANWKDLLTNIGGKTIEYDAIGNPNAWYGDCTALTWTNGRQLKSCSNSAGTVNYTYDVDGLRTSKSGLRNSEYYIVDGVYIGEKTTIGNVTYTVAYIYDDTGSPAGLWVTNGTTTARYWFIKTLQGDITGILDSTGNLVATYSYDAWGNILSSNTLSTTGLNSVISTLNPFRYRGYMYDEETGFYYLRSRYYDPAVGRFLNADNQIPSTSGDIQGYNMFAYCMNNPVNMSDTTGSWPQWIRKIANWVNNNIIQPIKRVFTPSKKSNLVRSSSKDPNRRPYNGDPGSTYIAPNGDTRKYGPDGTPEHDYDHNDHGRPDKHPHDPNGGHNHDWENGVRGPAYSIDWEPIAGVALVTVCVVGIVAVAVDDITGIGFADDFLFEPLGAGVGEGFILIFG